MGDQISDIERKGIEDLLQTQFIPELIISLARIISKNLLQPRNISEALNAIFLHSSSTHSILNRKLITKEILFKYLHSNKVAVKSEFTKQLLIDKIIEFWEGNNRQVQRKESEDVIDTTNECYEVEMIEDETQEKTAENFDSPEHFPINQMSRKFAAWFYSKLNCRNLQAFDFWRECECSVQFFNQKVCAIEETHNGSESVAEICRELKDKYELYFNLNESHSGTQGRIDRHGLVLVLSCGSLHKINELVGIFESVFALSRDPFTENNWKINRISLKLHNFGSQSNSIAPVLIQCQSLAPLLNLEATGNENI